MSERNPMYQHPEWDLPGAPKALIGAEPIQELGTSTEAPMSNPPQPETEPEKSLDIPSLIRLFQTDASPIPEGAPVRIAVGKEASVTLFPDETIEYHQQTNDHTIYLKAGKGGEVAFSLIPVQPVGQRRAPSPLPPPDSLSETVPADKEALLPAAGEPGYPPEEPLSTTRSQDQAQGKEKERIVVTGRVGREPTIKQIKTGLMAKFPVAEHREDGGTSWHTIVAFGKSAEALRDSLTKGRMVTVTGYPHEREVMSKTGLKRTVTEIYLAGLQHHK